jgi:hypothetical protein
MTEEDSKLVERAEKLVAELPLKEPDWETLANRVEKESLLPPATDESLFVAPLLEAEPGESLAAESPAVVAAVATPPAEPAREASAAKAEEAAPPAREPVSLADLARATVAKRDSAESASIARASLDIASQQRGQVGPVGVWIGVGIAAIGLAAGFGLYLTAEREKETIIVAGAPAQAPAPQAQAPVGAGPAEPPSPAGAKGGDAVEGPRGVSLDALEREGAAPGGPAPAAAPAPAPGAKLAAGAGATGTGVKPERVVLEEDRGREAAPQAAVTQRPVGGAVLKPAELGRDSGSADRPSAGAAQAAVGAVLGAARSCIAGHPKPSSATIVFGSSGEVSQVSVGGEAAGTAAAGCIESALKKARVQPFAAPTFSLAVTVRPP